MYKTFLRIADHNQSSNHTYGHMFEWQWTICKCTEAHHVSNLTIGTCLKSTSVSVLNSFLIPILQRGKYFILGVWNNNDRCQFSEEIFNVIWIYIVQIIMMWMQIFAS